MERDGKRGEISRRVRQADIARRCGVSVATVSRALGEGGGVAPEVRAAVLETARRLNYPLPTSLAGKRVILAASAAAMVDYARNQFSLHVLEGLRERAETLGMAVETRTIAGPEDKRAVLAEAAESDLAGLLFLTLDDEDLLSSSRTLAKPLVLINGEDPGMRLSSVSPCNRSAAALAAAHLRSLGHRRILFLQRPGRRTIAQRREGWAEAMGADAVPELVEDVADYLPDMAEAVIARRLARGPRDFTAILAAADALAAGALRAVQAAGLRVPEDISVMGIDGLPQAVLQNPPLTTVDIPMRALGAIALDLLRETATGFELPVRRVELACRLAERASTGPVPAGHGYAHAVAAGT